MKYRAQAVIGVAMLGRRWLRVVVMWSVLVTGFSLVVVAADVKAASASPAPCAQSGITAYPATTTTNSSTTVAFWMATNAWVEPFAIAGHLGFSGIIGADLKAGGTVVKSGAFAGAIDVANDPIWTGDTYTNTGSGAIFTMVFTQTGGRVLQNEAQVHDPTCFELPQTGAGGVGNLQGPRAVIGAAGHPVNTATGNFFHTQMDGPAPAGVFGLDVVRTYNSSDVPDLPLPVPVPAPPTLGPGRYGLFGPGWTSSFDVSLRSLDVQTNPFGTEFGVELRSSEGRRVQIPWTGSAWAPPAELFSTLTWDSGPSEFVLTSSGGTVYRFNSAGRLASIDDAHGQTVRACPATGTISSVRANVADCTATPKWKVDLNDTTSPPDGLIDQVVFPDTSKVDYTYATVASQTRLATATTRYKTGETPGGYTFTSDPISGSITQVLRKVAVGDSTHPDVIEVANHYDALGRVDYQTLEDGDHLVFTYGGLTGVAPNQRRPTSVAYCQTWNTSTGACTTTDETFVYAHDSNGILRETTDSTTGTYQAKKQWANDELTQFNTRRNAQTSTAYDAPTGRPTTQNLADPANAGVTSGSTAATYCGTTTSADDARVKTTTDALGNVTTYFYGTNPDTDPQCQAGSVFPTKVVDPQAHASKTTYAAGGLPLTVTDADGVVTTNVWDVPRRLLLASTVGAATTYFGYDTMGLLVVTRTGVGEETWTVYDGMGRTVQKVGPVPDPGSRGCTPTVGCTAFIPTAPAPPAGPTVTTTYYLDGTPKTSQDAEGNLTTTGSRYVNTAAAPCAGAAQGCKRRDFEQSAAFSGTDPRQLTTVRDYDQVGRLLTSKNGQGADTATTSYTYTQMGRIDVSTDPVGIQTKYYYDADGNLTKTITGNSLTDAHAVSISEYDLRGRLTRTSGPTGDVDETGASAQSCTANFYDQMDRVIRTEVGAYPSPSTIPGCVASTGIGKTKLLKTWMHYDAAGHQDFTVVDHDGTGAAPVWDAAGNLTTIDPNDHVTQHTFTAAGRPKDTIEPPVDYSCYNWITGNDCTTPTPIAVAKRTTTTTYYANTDTATGQFPGMAKAVTDPVNGVATTNTEYDLAGRTTKVTTPGGAYTRTVYGFDPTTKARLTQTFTPSPVGTAGLEVRADQTSYKNGWLKTAVPAHDTANAGLPVSYTYFGNGLTKTVTNQLAGANDVVNYTYDTRGNRTSRVSWAKNSAADTAHQVTESWAWYLDDQLKSSTDPANQVTNYAYFTNTQTAAGQVPGKLKTVTQPSGRVDTATYWNNGAVKTQVASDPAQPGQDVTTSTWWSARQQRTRTQAPYNGSAQNTDEAFDQAGNLLNVSQPTRFGNRTTSYTYSLVDQVRDRTIPDTAVLRDTHDKLGRLTAWSIQFGASWIGLATYAYTGDGQEKQENVIGSQSRVWTYGAANKAPVPTRYQQVVTGGVGNTDTTLTWRPDGRLGTETTAAVVTAYGYDTAGQITCRATGIACPMPNSTCTGGAANVWLYAYGPRGNRLCQSAGGAVTNYTANNVAQLTTEVTGTTTVTNGYDLDGRLTTATNGTVAQNVTIAYDPRGLTKTITTGSAVENRTYNGDGLLTYTDAGGTGKDLLWDPTNSQVNDTMTATSTYQRYGYGLERVSGPGGYYAYDVHGSAINSSTIAAPTGYDPFGNPTGAFVSALYVGYGGQLTVNNRTYLRARDYNPTDGVFTTRDRLDGVDGTTTVGNPYHYTNNDPVNLQDPTGLRPSDSKTVTPSRNTPTPTLPSPCASSNKYNLLQMNAAPLSQRQAMFHQALDGAGVTPSEQTWFANIDGVLRFFAQRNLAGPGQWTSIVDSSILLAVMQGAEWARKGCDPGSNFVTGASDWAAFFQAIRRDGANPKWDLSDPKYLNLRRLWGTAEQAATDGGVSIAASFFHHQFDDPREKLLLIDFGNYYRSVVRDPNNFRNNPKVTAELQDICLLKDFLSIDNCVNFSRDFLDQFFFDPREGAKISLIAGYIWDYGGDFSAKTMVYLFVPKKK